MKNLLLFILLFSGKAISQNNYSLQKEIQIYDIPGGEFLTAITKNDSTFINHYDVTGNIIWGDTLTFSPQISPVYLNEITRFKNSNDYVISVFADPTPLTPFWQSFSNDTLVYQFSKLDLSSHNFTGSLIDTFSCKSVDLIELKDTSIYLLVSDLSLDPSPFNHTTYSLNSSMELSLIAPLDSVSTNTWGWSYFVCGDSIYKHQSIEDYHTMDKFSFQMSTLSTNSTNLITSQDYNFSYFKNVLNCDSLFVFTQGTTSGSYAVQWRMDWLNLSLDPISSVVFNSPLTDQSPLRYSTGFNNFAIDKVNKRIMILSKDEAPMPSNVVQKIFIYDFNFNLECEIPIGIGNDQENSLIELNDRVYLRNDNSLNTELTKIDCSTLAIEEQITKKEFDISPNPTQSNISISNPDQKALSIIVLSSDGKQLIKLCSMEKMVSLDLSSLPKGLYLLQINEGTKTETTRIIKD